MMDMVRTECISPLRTTSLSMQFSGKILALSSPRAPRTHKHKRSKKLRAFL